MSDRRHWASSAKNSFAFDVWRSGNRAKTWLATRQDAFGSRPDIEFQAAPKVLVIKRVWGSLVSVRTRSGLPRDALSPIVARRGTRPSLQVVGQMNQPSFNSFVRCDPCHPAEGRRLPHEIILADHVRLQPQASPITKTRETIIRSRRPYKSERWDRRAAAAQTAKDRQSGTSLAVQRSSELWDDQHRDELSGDCLRRRTPAVSWVTVRNHETASRLPTRECPAM